MVTSTSRSHIGCLDALFCLATSTKTSHKLIQPTGLVKGIPGLYIFPNTISPQLETHLLQALDDDNDYVPWVDRKSRVTKNYGPHYKYSEWEEIEGGHTRRMRHCDGVVHYTEIPGWLFGEVMPVLREVGGGGLLKEFEPNQVHVAKYDVRCGHRIGMHNDNRMGVLGDFIVGVCLGDRCDMVFENEDGGKRKCVGLERRCVYVMSGESHRKWKHGIAKGNTRGVRVSITLRELLEVKVEEGVKLMPKKGEKRNGKMTK